MLLRTCSQPLEIEECVYDYISKEGNVTYEPIETPISPSVSPPVSPPLSPSISKVDTHISRPASFFTQRSVTNPSPPLSPTIKSSGPRSTKSSGRQSTSHQPRTLGLPKDWIIFPLGNRGLKHKKSIRVCVEGQASNSAISPTLVDSPCGIIDVDWTNPDEPVKLSAVPNDPAAKPAAHGSQQNHQAQARIEEQPLEPICFSVVEAEVEEVEDQDEVPASHALKRAVDIPLAWTEDQMHDMRRKSRHLIRVVTRNSLGLGVTTALSAVAPQLLIAAAINAFCLCRGAYNLHEHRLNLLKHGMKIRKRDIAIAISEGVVVKLALMIITISHDDLLVFANTFLAPIASEALIMHHDIFSVLPDLPEPAKYFELPVDKAQEFLGIATASERATNMVAGGWNESTKLLLQNIFIVGSIQAGMEFGLDFGRDHLGSLTTKTKDKFRALVKPSKGHGHEKPSEAERLGLEKATQAKADEKTLKIENSEQEKPAQTPSQVESLAQGNAAHEPSHAEILERESAAHKPSHAEILERECAAHKPSEAERLGQEKAARGKRGFFRARHAAAAESEKS